VWREEAGGPGDLPTITIWRYFVQMLNLQLRRPSTRGRHSSRVFPQFGRGIARCWQKSAEIACSVSRKAKISARNLPHVAPIQHALPKIKTNESMVY
jgi:hypothetical protein